jgi:hypothetical protein
MALIAADSTVIANPVWIHTITTMSISVFSGESMRNCRGSSPTQTSSWLSRPVWLTPGWFGRNS